MIDLEILVYSQDGTEYDVDFIDLDYGLSKTMTIIIKKPEDKITRINDRGELIKLVHKNEWSKPRDYYAPVTNGYCFDW